MERQTNEQKAWYVDIEQMIRNVHTRKSPQMLNMADKKNESTVATRRQEHFKQSKNKPTKHKERHWNKMLIFRKLSGLS